MKKQNIFRTFIWKILFSGFFPVIFFSFFYLIFASQVLASASVGTIDTVNKYAWGENLGWINFGCTGCNVEVTDTAVTGYAWSSKYGWINLSPTNSGVVNTAEGILSGMAWGRNIGWIDFDGVTISNTGEFLGYATVQSNSSQINFNCVNGLSCTSADFKVSTDWLPASVRPVTSGGTTSGSAPRNNNQSVATNPVVVVNTPSKPNIIKKIIDFINPFDNTTEPAVVSVPQIAPPALSFKWNLLPADALRQFVFAPLPYEIRILANKFPELDKTLTDVGVTRLADLNKLVGVNLNVPDIADILNKTLNNLGTQDIANIENIKGVGLNVPGGFSDKLPAEFVFARASSLDLNVALSVGEKGEVNQQISLLPGKTVRLVVKPISTALSVNGYIIFKSATPRVAENSLNSILRSSLTASALFSTAGLVETVPENLPPIEKKLVLSSFEYLDGDHDGIYTADVTAPSVPGEYEVITVIDYQDPVLGSRKMSLIAVIDPEGYVFEKNNGKETRIPNAVVSLYVKNYSAPVNQEDKLWRAEDYLQTNPQTTDIRGTYSFLVPAGEYYFKVDAPGYRSMIGEPFIVTDGNGIHKNIELKSAKSWWQNHTQTILVVVVLLLLVYNDLYRNRMRDKLLNLQK